METTKQWFDVGASVGRQQAFSLVSTRCTAAQALCLKQIRESRSYEGLGLTWEEFCKQHAGMSRGHADSLIRRHAEFGEAFFRLSEIASVSEETFREIAGKVDGGFIELEGEKLSLTPENAPQIRAGIQRLRAELKSAMSPHRPYTHPSVTDLLIRSDAFLEQLNRLIRPIIPLSEHAALSGLINYTIAKLKALSRDLSNITPE